MGGQVHDIVLKCLDDPIEAFRTSLGDPAGNKTGAAFTKAVDPLLGTVMSLGRRCGRRSRISSIAGPASW
jgi:hypothetical protein